MITKILIFILVFAILIVIREIWALIKAIYKEVENKVPTNRLISLGLAIAYIITIICTGI